MSELAPVHAQLATYWAEIALASGAAFTARLRSAAARSPTPASYGEICRLWIDCAEQAYARAVHKREFCEALARWINSSSALMADRNRPLPRFGTRLSLSGTFSPARAGADRNAGCSVRETVWRTGLATLHRYQPLPFTRWSASRPVLICYALVNRPYILDLTPESSWVRPLLASGRTVYLIEWGEPTYGEHVGIGDYVERYLGGCVRFLLKLHSVGALDLIGVCQGGTLSLCYTALHPQQISNLVTLTTPVDFHTADNLLSKWLRGIDLDRLGSWGPVSGQLLTSVFLALMPFRLTLGKLVMLSERCQHPRALEDFMRIERWAHEGPSQAAPALSQFVKWFYQENRLLRGTLQLAGQRVDLKRIFQPVLNIFALRDHIVPPAASAALQQLIGSSDYCAHPVHTGHIGIYVGRRCQQGAVRRMISWLDERRS
jgi:polyhydroxyalkanoate synthase